VAAMIPEHFEYLFLLLLFFLLIVTFLREPAMQVVRKRAFWLSGAIFCLTWALIEIYALRSHFWVFSPNKICGVFIATVPLEEYIVFALIHLSTATTWSVLRKLP
jgi:lycopene cyclase domain-containing protein